MTSFFMDAPDHVHPFRTMENPWTNSHSYRMMLMSQNLNYVLDHMTVLWWLQVLFFCFGPTHTALDEHV